MRTTTWVAVVVAVAVVLAASAARGVEPFADPATPPPAPGTSPTWFFQHVPHTSGRNLFAIVKPWRLPASAAPGRDRFVATFHPPWAWVEAALGPDAVASMKIVTIARHPCARLHGCWKHLQTLQGAVRTTFPGFVRDLYDNHRDRIVSGDASFADLANVPERFAIAHTYDGDALRRREQPYRWWVMWNTFTLPAWVFAGTRAGLRCTAMWKFEDGPGVYADMYRYLGLPSGTKMPHYVDKDPDWRSAYTPELERLVAELYADDFRLFGYESASR